MQGNEAHQLLCAVFINDDGAVQVVPGAIAFPGIQHTPGSFYIDEPLPRKRLKILQVCLVSVRRALKAERLLSRVLHGARNGGDLTVGVVVSEVPDRQWYQGEQNAPRRGLS